MGTWNVEARSEVRVGTSQGGGFHQRGDGAEVLGAGPLKSGPGGLLTGRGQRRTRWVLGCSGQQAAGPSSHGTPASCRKQTGWGPEAPAALSPLLISSCPPVSLILAESWPEKPGMPPISWVLQEQERPHEGQECRTNVKVLAPGFITKFLPCSHRRLWETPPWGKCIELLGSDAIPQARSRNRRKPSA